MNIDHVAVWILGPAGSGKSTLGAALEVLGFEAIDQDRVAETLMRQRRVPLDTRLHSRDQRRAFELLREQVADQVWDDVKGRRERGRPLVYEVTGNKPDFLEAEVIADRAAGYRVLAVGLRTPLEICQSRNMQRERVLPIDLVDSTWADFRRAVKEGTYSRIFGSDAFYLAADSSFAIDGWLIRELHKPN